MDETTENIDSLNDETTTEEVADTTTETEKEEPTFTDAERKAFARAKVAEAKVKELKAQLEKGTSKKSDGLDYGQKAYLASMGYKDSAEIKLAHEIMKESGKDLEGVLESKYFKSEVESMRELKKTADATPTGKRSGNSPLESVEYWMTKPFEEVPKDMRPKVVQAKLDKSNNKGKFYDS